jgi:hypothetical protein
MKTVSIDFSEHVRDFDWFAQRLNFDGARIVGDRDILCRCPAHDDNSPSLHIWEDGQGLGVHCFAGCSRSDIEDAIEDAKPRKGAATFKSTRSVRGEVVAVYEYFDPWGKLIYRKRRFKPKSFDFQRPVVIPARTEGSVTWDQDRLTWVRGLKDRDGHFIVNPVPYNLPLLQPKFAKDNGMHVAIVDGEKDADVLYHEERVPATCSPFGMANWWPEWDQCLAMKHVSIVADRDEPGYAAAAKLKARLLPIALSVRIVEAAEGKDTFDHFNAGYGLRDFRLVEGV